MSNNKHVLLKEEYFILPVIGLLLLMLIILLVLPIPASAVELPDELESMIQDRQRMRAVDAEKKMTGETDALRVRIRECLDAGIKTDQISPVVERSLETGMGFEHLGLVLNEMLQARIAGLPVSPISAKVQEGLVKKAGAPAIIRAMEKTRLRMEFSAGCVDLLKENRLAKRQRSLLIVETAKAIAAGMDPKHVRETFELMAGTGTREMTMARVMTTVELMKRARGYGAGSEIVRNLAMETIRNRYTEQELIRAANRISQAKRHGQSPNDLADDMGRRIRNGESLQDIERGRSGAGDIEGSSGSRGGRSDHAGAGSSGDAGGENGSSDGPGGHGGSGGPGGASGGASGGPAGGASGGGHGGGTGSGGSGRGGSGNNSGSGGSGSGGRGGR